MKEKKGFILDPFIYLGDIALVNDLREQASAMGACGIVSSVGRLLPPEWKLKGTLWDRFQRRVERKAGL